MTRLLTVMILLAGGSFLSGCGGEQPPATDASAPGEPLVEEAEEPAPPTAAELIRSEPDLVTYARLMELADLSGAIESTEGVILFAPTDAAFEALPEGILDTLEAPESRGALEELMGYHLVTGDQAGTEFGGGSVDLITHQGAPVTVAANGDFLTIGTALVSRELASEGQTLVYVIDSVLFPPEAE